MEMRLPHEIKSEETKNKIMEATKRMLEKYDFKYLTVRNICSEAGVAYGSFYHHFSSKENLLFIYTKELYQAARAENPVPDWIDGDDYIKNVLWHIIVYGCFCEAMGKELIKYLMQYCPQNLFDETFEEVIIPLVELAVEQGYARSNMIVTKGQTKINFIAHDLEIIYKGIVMWWSNSDEDKRELLHQSLSHLCFNIIYSSSTSKYREAGFPISLVADSPHFPGSIVINGKAVEI